jgi:hypothetical protein
MLLIIIYNRKNLVVFTTAEIRCSLLNNPEDNYRVYKCPTLNSIFSLSVYLSSLRKWKYNNISSNTERLIEGPVNSFPFDPSVQCMLQGQE